MTEASVVDCEDMSVRLRDQRAVRVGAPALSYVTSVAVDFLAISVFSSDAKKA